MFLCCQTRKINPAKLTAFTVYDYGQKSWKGFKPRTCHMKSDDVLHKGTILEWLIHSRLDRLSFISNTPLCLAMWSCRGRVVKTLWLPYGNVPSSNPGPAVAILGQGALSSLPSVGSDWRQFKQSVPCIGWVTPYAHQRTHFSKRARRNPGDRGGTVPTWAGSYNRWVVNRPIGHNDYDNDSPPWLTRRWP